MKAYTTNDEVPAEGMRVLCEGKVTRLFFDYDETGGDDGGDCSFECVEVRGTRGYGAFVAAIVNDRYTTDDQEAILANRALAEDGDSGLDGSKVAEYRQEYSAFQQWRTHAKEVARKAVAILKERG